LATTPLKHLPSKHLTWAAWKMEFPSGEVLSTDTGHQRDYVNLPYQGYENTPRLVFPVPEYRTELSNKDWILGVIIGREAKAFVLEKLATVGSVKETLGGKRIEIAYDAASRQPKVKIISTGEPVPYVKAYWFALQAYYPETKLWNP